MRVFVAVLALALAPRFALAQACCAGGTVLTPGRLNLHEIALVGVQLKAGGIIGSYDGTGAFIPPSKGASEADLEQDLIASVRWLDRGQFTFIVPLVETYRKELGVLGPQRAFGGGFGDAEVAARWDVTWPGSSRIVPGVALLASATLPTGKPVDEGNTGTLGVEATGTGALQGAFGVAFEQTFDRLLVNATGSATVYSARTPEGVHTELGPSFAFVSAVGWSFDPGPAVAATFAYTASLRSVIDGAAVPDSQRAQLTLGLAAGYVVNDAWRVQGGVYLDPPARDAGRNETSLTGATFTVFRTW